MNSSDQSAPDQAAASPEVGSVEGSLLPPVIPDHVLLRRIGRGSYGEIWLARTIMGSFRAVKIIYRATFDHDRPFEREFEGLKKFEPISHARESQVDIFHVGRNDAAGCFYYVMELADSVAPQAESVEAKQEDPSEKAHGSRRSGTVDPHTYVPRTLKHDLRTHGALPAAECLQIALCLCNALEHLHQHDLVHRDVKPSNIIFVGGRPKLADIGLVSSIDATRSLVGTDGYMAPEGPGTPRADVYSLGKVLYECVTGKDRLEFPQLPSGWRSDPEFNLLLELNEIVLKACEFDPTRRYQSAQEMSSDLAAFRDGRSIRSKRSSDSRRKVLKRIAAVTLAAGVLVTIAMLALKSPDKHGSFSSNTRAQKLYEYAVYQRKAGTFERTMEACTNLLEAVRLDDKFIPAYHSLFELYLSDWRGRLPPYHNDHDNFEWIASKIRELSPDSGADHAANADRAYRNWDFETALGEARRACQIDPQLRVSHILYGWFLLLIRADAKTARQEFEAAERIDYSDVLTQSMFGRTYYLERNFTMAIESFLEALKLEHRWNYSYLSWAYEATHQFHEALAVDEADETTRTGASTEARKKYQRYKALLDHEGVRAMWQSMLDDERNSPDPDLYKMARLCARLGDTNQVYALLDRARKAHAGHMEFLLFDDCWDSLRNDPRFDRQLDLMHLPKIKPPRSQGTDTR